MREIRTSGSMGGRWKRAGAAGSRLAQRKERVFIDRGTCTAPPLDPTIFGGTPLSQNGLVSLDPEGKPVFRYGDLIGLATPVPQPSGINYIRFGDLAGPVLGDMAHCYALNVCSGKEVWLYYYTEFPLVQLIEGAIEGWWPAPVRGSKGLAVAGGRVLMGGGYDDRDSLFLGDLGAEHFRELTPVTEEGRPLRDFRPFGRRHLLFLATADALYAIDLCSV
jgi:hypothetical protein